MDNNDKNKEKDRDYDLFSDILLLVIATYIVAALLSGSIETKSLIVPLPVAGA